MTLQLRLPPKTRRTKVFEIGGTDYQARINTFVFEATEGYKEDIQALAVSLVLDITAQQEALGNPYTRMLIDGSEAKPLYAYQKKAEVYFGAKIDRAAMMEVEIALQAAILESTKKQTGTLSNIRGSWQWIFLKRIGQQAKPLGGPQDIVGLSPGDSVILMPKRVRGENGRAYASVVNHIVKSGNKGRGGGKLSYVTKKRKRKGKVVGGNKHFEGFLGRAVKKCRGRSALKNLSVYAGFTSQFAMPGEQWIAGNGNRYTGFIRITAKRQKGVFAGQRGID